MAWPSAAAAEGNAQAAAAKAAVCANRAARFEFWNLLACELTVEAVSRELPGHDFLYNFERPHSALDYLTPNEYRVA